MTPDFALSLSFDGIRLLHRGTGGWHLVGEVKPDAPDVAAELGMLRKTAQMLESGPIRTKIVIPSDQIKFITIETAQTSDADIEAALDGATPYSLKELAYDADRAGGRTYIAAVAKETLAEAEAFASEHKFNPVALVAEAEPLTFRQEVFFGPTKAAAEILAPGETVEPDTTPIQVLGAVDLPTPAPIAETTPVIPAEEAPEGAAVSLKDFTDEPTDPVEDPVEPAPEVVFASRARATTVPPQDVPVATPAPKPALVAEAKPPAKATTRSDEPLFTRRRTPPPLAVPVGVEDGPPVAGATGETIPPASAPVTASTPPVRTAPPLTGDSAVASSPQKSPPLRADRATSAPAKKRAPAPAAVEDAPADDAERMAVFGTRNAASRKAPRFFLLKLTAALIVFLVLVALWAGTLGDNGLAALFRGGDDTPEAVAAAPVADPVDEAMPSSAITATPDVVAAPLPAPDPQPVTPAPSALDPAPITPEVAEAEPARPLPIVRAPTNRILSPAEAERIYAATGVWQRAPRFPLDPRITSLDGFVAYAALPEATRPEQALLPGPDAAVPDAALRAQPNPPPPGTRFQRDLRGFILAMPDGVVTPDGALVIAGEPEILPPTRPGTEAPEITNLAPPADAVEGLVLIAGPPPRIPPLRPEGLVPAEPQQDALALPEAPAAPTLEDNVAATAAAVAAALQGTPTPDADTTDETDLAAAPVSEPVSPTDAAPDTEVVTTRSVPADVIAPDLPDDGVVVSFGPPPVLPRDRPADLAPATPVEEAAPALLSSVVINPADAITPGGVALASFKPAIRPGGLAPVIASDPALAGYRPSVRPEGLAPAPEAAEPEPVDIASVAAALAEVAPPSPFQNVTSRAIPISARPDTRPRNFSRVVAAAQQRAARQQQTAVAPRATTTTQQVSAQPARPTGPIPGGVARAATLDNAIALRQINLIGVYGRPNDRRALVRLSNGRYVKVEVGSSLDGGRVTAIGDNALNYIKRGRTYALQIAGG